MRTLVHLSDLHFGRVHPLILPPVITFIRELKPDVIAISGDLTQRARTAEFLAAREFLDALPFPKVIVPGNHDVPLPNLLSRFIGRLGRYRRYISADLQPVYINSEIVVVGINTARAFTWKSGRINRAQLAKLRATLQAFPEHTKVVVTHHPFDLPEGAAGHVVGRSRLAIATLAECRVDLLLAGHFHIAHTGQTVRRYKIHGYSAVIVSAGTSTSTRSRGQPNSFNVIRIDRPHLAIERRVWNPKTRQLDILSIERFVRTSEGWMRE